MPSRSRTRSRAPIEKSAAFSEYYAEHAERLLAPRPIEGGGLENYVRYEPIGAVLAVMPWNFPYVQVFRFAPPTLAAGNVALLKHASNIPGCAVMIQEVFQAAGFPEGVFQTLLIGSGAVEGILSDPRVRGVALTGSDAAGSKVAAVADEFETLLAEAAASLKVGDPLERDTDVGPLARPDLVADLRRQVEASTADGSELLVGGFDADGSGCFVRPIVRTGVTPDVPVFQEETFGPVAAVTRARDEQEAIALADQTQYGLGASIWTNDLDRARHVAERIEAGMVFVNSIVFSDARLPFGGMKRSGYGRELGEDGIKEFVDVKSVALHAAPQPAPQPAAVAEANE